MAGLRGLPAMHTRIILSRGRLVTVEAPGYPRHPSSIQHNAAVNLLLHDLYSVHACVGGSHL